MASSYHCHYFLKLTAIVLLCFFPLVGVKISLTFVFSFPAFFSVKATVMASCPLAVLDTLETPLPLAVTFPAEGT